jgi:hypothetical protein
MRSARYGLIGLTTFLALSMFQPDGMASDRQDAASPACDTWLKRTLKAVEASSTLRHRDTVVLAVTHACIAVPEGLRAAAVSYKKARTEKTKAQILADAATAVLQHRCSASDPLGTAEGLVAECPLPGPGEKAHPAVLGRMRAADYLFLNALMTSLIAADKYDATAYRIVLEFIVSSAELGEERKATTRK